MQLPLFFLAASAALVTYWWLRLLPLPPERRPPRVALFYPLELEFLRELARAGLSWPARHMVTATLTGGALGGLALVPLRSLTLSLVGALTGTLLPWLLVRTLQLRRRRAVGRAVVPALAFVAELCVAGADARQAMHRALPMLEPPLKEEWRRALRDWEQDGTGRESLHDLASRCGGAPSLHLLADLVTLAPDGGPGLADSLARLTRYAAATEHRQSRAEASDLLLGLAGWLPALLTALVAVFRSPRWMVPPVPPLTAGLGALVLLSLSLPLGVYAWLTAFPRYSRRAMLVRRWGRGGDEGAPARFRGLGWLRGHRRRVLIARTLPSLTGALALLMGAGADMSDALTGATKAVSGPLRDQVERLAAELSQSPPGEALERFADRCRTPEARALVRRIRAADAAGLPLPVVLEAWGD